MNEFKLNVKGMMCAGCENRVKNAILKIEGVQEVTADHQTGIVGIIAAENVSINLIKAKIQELDFEIV